MAPLNIFVIQNDQKLGPYTEEEVRLRLQTKQFHQHNLGWHDGVSDWLPLSQLLEHLPPQTRRRRRRKSPGFSRAAFFISLIGLGLWVVVFFPAATLMGGGESSNSSAMLVIQFLNYVIMAANITGIFLAVVALNRPYSNKAMALYGLTLNSLELLFGVFLIALA